MANTLLTISLITREALRVLENNLVAVKQINRQFDDRFGVDGAKIGSVVNVRKPPRYTTRTGQALDLQDAVETQVPVTLDTQIGVDMAFSSSDLALSIDDFSDRFLAPAVAAIANRIDAMVLGLYKDVNQSVGTPGTTPNDLLTYLLAGVQLNNSAAPLDGQRAVIISPLMEATLVDALKGLFQQSDSIAAQYSSGTMGRAAGFKFSMDQNVATHTVGTYAGTPLADYPTSAPTEGTTTVNINGWTGGTSTLNQGDTFTFAGVHSVNPQSRQSTGLLQRFVVTATTTESGGAMTTLPVYPALITSGAFQTIDVMPANDAAVVVNGASATQSPQGLAFHKDAFTLVTADLPLPGGVDKAARMSDKQLGISIRMIRAYDINSDRFPCRLDVLCGVATLRPELACRVAA